MTTLSHHSGWRRPAAAILSACAFVTVSAASAEALTASSTDRTVQFTRDEIDRVVQLDVYREGVCVSYLGLDAQPCSASMNQCAVTGLRQLQPIFMEFDTTGRVVRCEVVTPPAGRGVD